jgi:lipid-binding SYLF domain-containing protein
MFLADRTSRLTLTRRPLLGAALALGSGLAASGARADSATDRQTLINNARTALQNLELSDPRAKQFGARARAVLVFPSILKAGFIFGGQTGNGVLFVHGKAQEFFNMSGGSFGLQAGGQDFSYALFFMTQQALDRLHASGGWAAGTQPGLVVVNKGAATDLDTTTANNDVYAFPFNQRGLMGSLSLEGTKITQIYP